MPINSIALGQSHWANRIGRIVIAVAYRQMKSITIAITGASGSVYAQKLLARLEASPEVARIDLVISQAGVRVVGEEMGLNVSGT
ncbi:MAG: flavoprotein, partial [Blastocatellia bacterium]